MSAFRPGEGRTPSSMMRLDGAIVVVGPVLRRLTLGAIERFV